MELKLFAATAIQEEGAICAAFLHEEFRELIVVFRGTSKDEWLDNFLGGAATEAEDGVSTKQQIKALKWYQEVLGELHKELQTEQYYVTVTGHSKGGNKAKYITVLDDSADRCVSFNGQGFSEEFILWYYARIGMRQSVIENHNIEYDYVNWLLHDFGAAFYYKNQMPEKGFLAGHCANAFLKIGEDGSCIMEQTGRDRPKIIEELDERLNHLLHHLSKKEKIELVEWIGTRVQRAVDAKEILSEISHFFQTIISQDVIY